jgi:small neutral amino acid transporter SnatA (MarC family)
MSAFVTLLLVVDPIGSATHGSSERDKTTIAIRSPLIAAAILVALNWLPRQLGIGIAAGAQG